ncbi:capsid protein [Bark beetle-associated genomovirus 2]|uniref:Capsid protein n=1 Tax=Bark beetle-associated genomovirus 2 TaxID=2230897 RepID=A0A344A3P8_9VIRU|nr:capsid protein [Bark beetle-associated genomovirus 2]AWU66513.1 capsid protein [Bark beetle-associated genomovirus 2]
MAYRGRGPVRKAYKAAAKRRYAGRSKFRRSYGKKRTYRKPMSKKRILNVTSKKKRDHMLSFSNTKNDGTSQTVAAGPFYNAGAQAYGFSIFSPTARSLVTGGSGNTTVEDADRTSSTVFMRGYSENLRIQTSSPLPWLWRRIVFCTKGPTFSVLSKTEYSPTQAYTAFSDTSIGMSRLWFNLNANASPITVAAYLGVLFKGVINQDWNDVIIAPVDTTRVTLLSDKTTTIKTGNSNGHFSERKLWYPFNKNLVYDDDEAGSTVASSYFSTDAKGGMGDVYIVDFTVPGIGNTASDIISMAASATLYWHEK